MRLHHFLAFGIIVFAERAASASVLASMCSAAEPKCERAPLAVSKTEVGPSDFDYDTGWVPASSPIQVRIVVAVHDRTQVDLAGTLDSTWPDPITMTPKGTPGQGRIAIDDGFEITMQARFTVTVAGNTYSWSGPIPYLPNVNFIAQGSQTFDPWAWQGDGTPPKVTAQTLKQKIVQYPLTNSIIPIPGISGGVELDGQADFSASYDTLRIGFDELNGVSPIPLVDPTHGATRLLLSSAPSFDTDAYIHGEVTRQVTLHFIPAFYFQILTQDFTLPLADLPVPLPATKPEPWDFDPVAMHVPLPQIKLGNSVIDVGAIPVGIATNETIGITDTGEELLVVDADTQAPMAAVGAAHFTVSPQQSASLKVTLAPEAVGAFDVMVHMASNDPLAPDSIVHIVGRGVPGSNISEAGGCGCRTVPGPANSPALPFAAFGLLVLRRRRQNMRA